VLPARFAKIISIAPHRGNDRWSHRDRLTASSYLH
jgi:hypothetical protein